MATHNTKLGDVNLVVNYDIAYGDIEIGTILMETNTGYADVTGLLIGLETKCQRANWYDQWETEIREAEREMPSYLNND